MRCASLYIKLEFEHKIEVLMIQAFICVDPALCQQIWE